MQYPEHGIGEEGFTLLELMVSILMVGLVSAIIAGSLHLGITTVDKGEKRIDALQRIRTSMNMILSQVQSQVPLIYDDEGEKKYYFQGSRDFLEFTSNYSIWSSRKGNVVVNYSVKQDNFGKQMITASEKVVGFDNSRATDLFRSLDSCYFEYFFHGPTDERGMWIDEWTETLTIPEKVKLNLVYRGKDFSMIIPVRVSGSTVPKPASSSSGFGTLKDLPGKP